MGRFKNKRVKVKSIDYNEKGDLQINGRPALKFRLSKSTFLIFDSCACVIFIAIELYYKIID